MRTTITIIGLLLTAPLVSAQNMQTSFVSQPASPNTISPSTYLYELQPGQSITDEIVIKNVAAEPKELLLYAVDAKESSTKNGLTMSYTAGGLEMTEVGNWIDFESFESEEPIIFKANETKTFQFTISIPETVDQQTYHGGLAMEQLFIPQNGSVSTALRKIEKVEITVTNNPREIPKQEIQTNIFGQNTVFHWMTLSIFGACFAYLLYSTVQKHAKNR